MINLPPSKPMLKWYAQVVSGERIAYLKNDTVYICKPEDRPADITPDQLLTPEAIATRLRMTFEEEPT